METATKTWTPLAQACLSAELVLGKVQEEWDAVICAGDMHGIALAAVIAEHFNKPLMTVCTHGHECVVSHIVMIGDILPDMRFLYVDDMFSFGASLKHVMDYMNQSEEASVVATYEVCRKRYTRLPATAG